MDQNPREATRERMVTDRSHLANRSSAGDLDTLITHGLNALRDTLQQDKDLTAQNTSIVSLSASL